jgi:hypothetical protein
VVEEYRDIYARVTGREQERGYPDQFMANPDVAPDAVASKLGIASEGVDLYRVTASIIGYFDGQMGDFANPRVAPDPGKEVRMADADELESVLTDVDPESEGSAHIGELLHRDPGEVDVHLPVDSFAATHLSILASTGSGKSYTAPVLRSWCWIRMGSMGRCSRCRVLMNSSRAGIRLMLRSSDLMI